MVSVDSPATRKLPPYDSSVEKIKKIITKSSNSELQRIFQAVLRLEDLTREAYIIEAKKVGIKFSENNFYSEICRDFYVENKNNPTLCICAKNAQSMRNVSVGFFCIYHFYLSKKNTFLTSLNDFELMFGFYQLFIETKSIDSRKILFIPTNFKKKKWNKIIEKDFTNLINFANKFKPFEQIFEDYFMELKNKVLKEMNV